MTLGILKLRYCVICRLLRIKLLNSPALLGINIYLYLILDKLGLDNEHSFVNMIIKVTFLCFHGSKPAIETHAQIWTNSQTYIQVRWFHPWTRSVSCYLYVLLYFNIIFHFLHSFNALFALSFSWWWWN